MPFFQEEQLNPSFFSGTYGFPLYKNILLLT
jgi:hypothetical protein